MLLCLVPLYKGLYGLVEMSINMQSPIYFSHCARNHGPLDTSNAIPSESYLFKIKPIINVDKHIAKRLVRRYSETRS